MTNLNAEIIEAEEVVGQIVKQIHAFSLATNLGEALQTLILDPTLKIYLPEAISKLGRYYSATSKLVCAARYRACRLFESIEVEPFQIPMPTVLLKSHWKVHAEIQLLFFYEVYPGRPRPRFICSSKSACYMCNLFFSLHGGFHVPRTHGRLYEKWTLPDWLDIPAERHEEFSRISTRLRSIIDSKTLKASKSKRKKQYHYPNESVLLPLAP
jgi:OTT_1508-like deaminase